MKRPDVSALAAAALLLAAVCWSGVAGSGSAWRRQRTGRALGALGQEPCGLRKVRAVAPPRYPYASYPPPAAGSSASRGPLRPSRPRRARSSDGGGSVEDTWEANNAFPLRQRARAGPYPQTPAAAPGAIAALYFSGGWEQLLLRPGGALAELPREEFTVEVWVKPEGGQNNPAIIAGN